MADEIHELTAAYALDALEARDRERYESHLATCEACRDELEAFWSVSGSLAHAAGGPPPPPALRERILELARSERPNVVPFRRRVAVPAVATLAAVAAVAALALGVWANSLSGELDRLRGSDEAVALLSDPSARKLPLDGANGDLVVTTNGDAALVVDGLDPPPAGKAYEIWVMKDGSSQRAGLFFGAETRRVLKLEHRVPAGATVGVTVEDADGVETPTTPPIFQSSEA